MRAGEMRVRMHAVMRPGCMHAAMHGQTTSHAPARPMPSVQPPPHPPHHTHLQLLYLPPKVDRRVVGEDVLPVDALLLAVVVAHGEVGLAVPDDGGGPERAAEAGAGLVAGRGPPDADLRGAAGGWGVAGLSTKGRSGLRGTGRQSLL
jgi:hypothetical protein